MTHEKIDGEELELDIVAYVLQRVIAMAPGFSQALARQIEQLVKDEHGGRRLYVPKGAKRMTAEQRQAVFKDGLTTMSTDEITKKHKISIRTLERTMKQGGRFGG